MRYSDSADSRRRPSLGLYHYFTDREKLDEELLAEAKFNLAASLNGTAITLPRIGLGLLAGAEEAFQSMSEADRRRIEKENWKPTLRIGEPMPLPPEKS